MRLRDDRRLPSRSTNPSRAAASFQSQRHLMLPNLMKALRGAPPVRNEIISIEVASAPLPKYKVLVFACFILD